MTICLVVSIPLLTSKNLGQVTYAQNNYQPVGEFRTATTKKVLGQHVTGGSPPPCLGAAPDYGSRGTNANQSDDGLLAIHGAGMYLDCAIAKATGHLEQSVSSQPSSPTVAVKPATPSPALTINPVSLVVAEVLANDTVARIGPNSNYHRVTPLLKGIKAAVVGSKEGDNNGKKINWIQLDYGGWVSANDLKIGTGVAPKSLVQNIRSQNRNGNTDVIFALQAPVPLVIDQTAKTLKLTLYNTTAPNQNNNIVKLTSNPIVDRVTSKSVAPSQVEYTFTYKSRQQWGYKYRYDGNNLVLSLRHPPVIRKQSNKPLDGIKILLDPGHGGADTGAIGSTGYTEKEASLFATKLLANELFAQGAKVYLTRDTDKAVSLDERRHIVEQLEPTISISLHYNSSPDDVDPSKAKGFSVFWYHSQSQGLANFLHSYTTQYGNRPAYGVIWDNLALARPAAAPAVLLELGFISSPEELPWISDPQAQEQLAKTLASGITQWLMSMT